MTSLSNHELNTITGGVTQGAPGTQSERYKEMCTVPDRKTARAVRLDARARDPRQQRGAGRQAPRRRRDRPAVRLVEVTTRAARRWPARTRRVARCRQGTARCAIRRRAWG